MYILVQRVQSTEVSVDGKELSSIGNDLLILLGIKVDDEEENIDYLVRKIVDCRIFDDLDGAISEPLVGQRRDPLVVDQSTLYINTKKKGRPSYQLAAKDDIAKPLYRRSITKLEEVNVPVQTREFGTDMAISLINDGPITTLIES